MAHDVFISYAVEDKAIADAVCAKLEANKSRCWIAPRDISPGVNWPAAIVQAIGQSKAMVLVYSHNANQSKQVQREVQVAANRGVIIIPLRMEDVPLTDFMQFHMADLHWLDAMTPPLEVHLQRLCDTVLHIVPPTDAGIPVPASAAAHRTPVADAAGAGAGMPPKGVLPGLARGRLPIAAGIAAVVLLLAGIGGALAFTGGGGSGGDHQMDTSTPTTRTASPTPTRRPSASPSISSGPGTPGPTGTSQSTGGGSGSSNPPPNTPTQAPITAVPVTPGPVTQTQVLTATPRPLGVIPGGWRVDSSLSLNEDCSFDPPSPTTYFYALWEKDQGSVDNFIADGQTFVFQWWDKDAAQWLLLGDYTLDWPDLAQTLSLRNQNGTGTVSLYWSFQSETAANFFYVEHYTQGAFHEVIDCSLRYGGSAQHYQ